MGRKKKEEVKLSDLINTRRDVIKEKERLDKKDRKIERQKQKYLQENKALVKWKELQPELNNIQKSFYYASSTMQELDKAIHDKIKKLEALFANIEQEYLNANTELIENRNYVRKRRIQLRDAVKEKNLYTLDELQADRQFTEKVKKFAKMKLR